MMDFEDQTRQLVRDYYESLCKAAAEGRLNQAAVYGLVKAEATRQAARSRTAQDWYLWMPDELDI
jgi:hypothetical protein